MTRIFINFRNGDGDWAAKLIKESFTRRFGENSVFLSSDSIPLAARFPAVLTESARTCAVMLALVGVRWLNGRGPDGRSPLFADGDWVRREIATALAAGRPVAAVRLDGARRLIADDLPSDIRELAERQDITLNRRSYDTDIARLEEELMKITPGLAAQPETEPRAGSRITVESHVEIGDAEDLNLYGPEILEGHRDLREASTVRINKAKHTTIHGLREVERGAKKAGPA